MNITKKLNRSIKSDLYPLVALAIPLVLTGMVQSSLGFFQNIFLAKLGEHALAAGAIVNWLFATFIVVLFGIFSAVNILVSHKHGANDEVGISYVFRDGILLAILLTPPTFFLFWHISSLFALFGQPPALIDLSKVYLHALAWGLFPKFMLAVLYELLLGLGSARTLMIVTLLTIPLYIFLSYALIFGKFGLPVFGVSGAGWGMTIADWILFLVICILLIFNQTYRPYIKNIFNFTKTSYFFEIIYLGFPMGAMYCLEVGFFFAMTLFMGNLSVQTLAANQLAMQYLGPLMGVIFCIAQAITVRMGHQIGAGEKKSAKTTAYLGVLLSACVMLCVAVIYITLPNLLISVDFDVTNPAYADTIRLAKSFFIIAAFFQIFEAMRIAFFGALRALKDTRFTLLVSTISFWGVALPIGYVLATHFKLGGAGMWYGMVVGASISVVLLYSRFEIRSAKL